MMRKFKCADCGTEFEEPFGTGRPACPKCGSENIYRIDEYAGMGPGFGRGNGIGKNRGLGRGRGFGRGRGRWIDE